MSLVRSFRLLCLPAAVLLAACGGGDKATAPKLGPPAVSLVNGVPLPSGLVGMTIVIQGVAFGDASTGKVLFTPTGGTALQASIVNPSTDWSNTDIITTVPQGVTSDAAITVQTAEGTSKPVQFTLISSAPFSPSAITWARSIDLPAALQGLGAAFVPVKNGSASASYVYAVGGADATNTAVASVSRAQVQTSGATGAWTTGLAALPQARAYHALAAATPYNAAFDTTTIGGYLYAIGGVDATGQSVSTVYVSKVGVDGSLGAWQTTTALPAALHSASATIVSSYLYVVGGASGTNAPVTTVYRASVYANGTLGAWQTLAALPQAEAFQSLAVFGPYMYVVGGDAGTTTPVLNTSTGTETGNIYRATINLRDGTLASSGWTTMTAMSKARSKHSVLAAGGALLASSGVYSGAAGSSENAYAGINADGTIGSWQGATGTNTIAALLGYSLYNEAAISFTDAAGHGHVMLLGGADRSVAGKASAAVAFY